MADAAVVDERVAGDAGGDGERERQRAAASGGRLPTRASRRAAAASRLPRRAAHEQHARADGEHARGLQAPTGAASSATETTSAITGAAPRATG